MRYFGGRKDTFDGEIKWVREQLQAHNIDKMGLGQMEDAHTTMIAQLRKVKDEEGLLSEEVSTLRISECSRRVGNRVGP